MVNKNGARLIYGLSVASYTASVATGIALLVYIHKRFVLKIDTIGVKNSLVLYGSLAIATFIAAIGSMIMVNYFIDEINHNHGIQGANTNRSYCLSTDELCCMALCVSCCSPPDISCNDNSDAAGICMVFMGVAGLVLSLFGYMHYAYKTLTRLNKLPDQKTQYNQFSGQGQQHCQGPVQQGNQFANAPPCQGAQMSYPSAPPSYKESQQHAPPSSAIYGAQPPQNPNQGFGFSSKY